MLKEERRRKISRREWEFLWNTCQMECIWKLYQGILNRKPRQVEFNSCYEEMKNSDNKLATAKTIAIELIGSTEFENDIRPNCSCEKIITGFLMAILDGNYTEDDYEHYVNYCKSDNKSQKDCEDIVEELLNFDDFHDRF
jgi:hypothetical protein